MAPSSRRPALALLAGCVLAAGVASLIRGGVTGLCAREQRQIKVSPAAHATNSSSEQSLLAQVSALQAQVLSLQQEIEKKPNGDGEEGCEGERDPPIAGAAQTRAAAARFRERASLLPLPTERPPKLTYNAAGRATLAARGARGNATVTNELHLCVGARIGFVHVFKSAGSFGHAMFRAACREETGEASFCCAGYCEGSERCPAHVPDILAGTSGGWRLWTIVRDPVDRFVSGMFEVARRVQLEPPSENVSSVYPLSGVAGKSADEKVRDFLRVEVLGARDSVNAHLRPQLDFLMHGTVVFENLAHLIVLGRGDLSENIQYVLADLFDSQGTRELKSPKNYRSRADPNYASEGGVIVDPGLRFFQTVTRDQLSEDMIRTIEALYFWDVHLLQQI